jgi:SAM-dependent methyltransferase
LDRELVGSLRGQGLDGRERKFAGIGFPDNHFDVITYFGSFEHVEDPVSEGREIRRILTWDGRLIISVANAGSLEAGLFGPHWFGFEAPPVSIYPPPERTPWR